MVDDLTELREGWGQPEPPSPVACSAARAALLEQAAAAPATMAGPARLIVVRLAQRSPGAARRSRRRTGWLAGGAGLTAAAVVAVAAVMASASGTAPAATGDGHAAAHPSASPVAVSKLSARRILLDAATAVAAAPARTGTYWYLKTIVPGPPRATLQTWYTRDGVGYSLAPDGRDVYRPSADCGFSVGGRWLTYGQLEHLPTDPAALKAWLTWSSTRGAWQPLSPCASASVPAPPRPRWSQTAAPRASGFAAELTSLLFQVPAPPALRAAAFRALASMPDVRKLGYADGGVVLAIHGPAVPASKFPSGKAPQGDTGVVKVIIDPTTFALRAESDYQGTTRILAAGWTDHMPKVVSISQAFPPKPRQTPSPRNG